MASLKAIAKDNLRNVAKNYVAQAVQNGRAIVIIPQDVNTEISLFWVKENVVYCYNRFFGEMKRDDYTLERLEEHLLNMIVEGAAVTLRGRND